MLVLSIYNRDVWENVDVPYLVHISGHVLELVLVL